MAIVVDIEDSRIKAREVLEWGKKSAIITEAYAKWQ